MANALSFTSAVSKYFGRKPGQTMAEFRDEIVALTPQGQGRDARHARYRLGV